MGLHGNTPSIIHSASTVDAARLTAFTYYNVYAGAGGGTATINGTLMNLGEGSDVSMIVRTINNLTVTGNVYLLGDKKNVFDGSPIIGGSFTTQ